MMIIYYLRKNITIIQIIPRNVNETGAFFKYYMNAHETYAYMRYNEVNYTIHLLMFNDDINCFKFLSDILNLYCWLRYYYMEQMNIMIPTIIIYKITMGYQ